MKRFLFIPILFLSIYLIAQPNAINYQAVVRNSSGQAVPQNTPVQFQFTIHDGSAGGPSVYTETSQTILANQFGLCNTAIGLTANLGTVNWSGGNKFLQVQVKTGSGSFVDMGTTQLLSVPYAMYAAKAGITDSVRPSGATTVTFTVKYNGVDLSNQSINHAVLSAGPTAVSGLTSTNYYYTLYKGTNNIQLFTPSYSIYATDTNSVSPTFYTATGGIGCGGAAYPKQGEITGVSTNHTTGVYYVPLSAAAATVSTPLYLYNCGAGHWTGYPAASLIGTYFYQLSPNNNSVTGFNLNFPVTVTITR